MRKLKNSELKRLNIEEFKRSNKIPLIVILDNVRSLNNVGSVFRTSDAFRIEKIYLCGITAQPPHKEIQKTALGATDSVDWAYEQNTLELIERLKEDRVQIVSVEQAEKSTSLERFIPEEGLKYAVIFGNEVKGVSQEVVDASDLCLEIPQFGTKHSLNIAVSCGVVLWDIFAKMNFKEIHH